MSQRSLEELVDLENPGWPLVERWLLTASKTVEILRVERPRAEDVLYQLQVTSRSSLGAVALNTGGVIFDNGWARLLGAGCERFPHNLANWNHLSGKPTHRMLRGALVVAWDVLGGFFAVNGDAFPGKAKNVFYLAPDSLRWEDFECGYSEFVRWLATGDFDHFYGDFRWPELREEVAKLTPDQGIHFWPPLWTKGEPVRSRDRRPVPITDLWETNLDYEYPAPAQID
jgi:hypothetical protein